MIEESVTTKMAIIKDVGYGARDVKGPVLWFTTYTSKGTAALQVLSGERADQIARSVHEIHELEGRSCWVDVRTPGTMEFIGLTDI